MKTTIPIVIKIKEIQKKEIATPKILILICWKSNVGSEVVGVHLKNPRASRFSNISRFMKVKVRMKDLIFPVNKI